MENKLAETVAVILFRAWVKRYGCPSMIHSDQERQNESELFTEVRKLLQINKLEQRRSTHDMMA